MVSNIEMKLEDEVIIMMDKEGFHYKGELIEDINEVYKRMCEYLENSGYPKPQSGETLVHTEEGTQIIKK